MAFNLDNYVEVKDRIAEFYMGYPDGSIRTFLVKSEGKEVMFEARVYRTPDEAVAGIYTSGFARELEGDGTVNKTSHVENCETSAIGRALANLNYCGTVAGAKAPRPSREEMSKASGGQSNGHSNPEVNPWDKIMPFGKVKGKKLGELSVTHLKSARAWCIKTDESKFGDLIGAINATLEREKPLPEGPSYDDPPPPFPGELEQDDPF